MSKTHLTVGEVASIYDAPSWLVRRVVDSLGVEIPRFGQYRLVPRSELPAIGIEIQRRRRGSLESDREPATEVPSS